MKTISLSAKGALAVLLAVVLAIGLIPIAPASAFASEPASVEFAEAGATAEAAATDSAIGDAATLTNHPEAPAEEILPEPEAQEQQGAAPLADDIIQSGDWRYTVNRDGTATACGYVGSAKDIAIPATLDGRTVTAISVNIVPVTSTSWRTESGFKTVESVEIPASVAAIKNQAFSLCWDLESVTFAANSQLLEISSEAFANSGITTFTMPASLRSIEESAFHGCPNLERIEFNDDLESILKYNNITDMSGTNHIEYYSPCAIASYSEVDFVVPPTSKHFSTDGKALFSKDGSILYELSTKYATGTYVIPSTVKEIGDEAFLAQENLTGVVLPDGLTTIHQWAFSGAGITSIDIPDSVTTMYWGAFQGCPSLERAVIGDGVEELGVLANGQNMFYGCSKLTSVTLGESVRMINRACFAETAITSIDIPESVEILYLGAFGDNKNLAQVTGCEGLREIYGAAFRNTSITSFPFGSNLELVKGDAFQGCPFTPSYPPYLVESGTGDWVNSALIGTLLVDGTDKYSYAYQVLDIVNRERAAAGVGPLTMDADLLDAAMLRAAETAVYWDHTRPTGETCFTVSDKAAGENIAYGNPTAESVMDSWMHSDGHRANILNGSYTSIGVGCFVTATGQLYWVQLFGTEVTNAPSDQADRAATHGVEVQFDFFQPSFTAQVPSGTQTQGEWLCLGNGQSIPVEMYVQNGSEDLPWMETHVLASSFEWSTRNPDAVAVDSPGTIRGVADGTAILDMRLSGLDTLFYVMSGYTPNAVFHDVDGHWGEGWVMSAYEANLMAGYSDLNGPTGVFGPDDNVSRGQLAVILYRHAFPDSTATTDPSAYEDNTTDMKDVLDKQYYTAAINWACEAGILTGDKDFVTQQPLYTVRPDSPVSRQEAATMIARYAAWRGLDTSADPSVYASAPDAAYVQEYARVPVAWCYQNGIMTGSLQTGELAPGAQTNRAAMAKIAYMTAQTIG